LELKAATRAGTVHVLPEELLALSLVELKTRAAAKLGGGEKKKQQAAQDGSEENGGGGSEAASQNQNQTNEPKAPRAVSLVVPCCWADAERTAAFGACRMVGLQARLVSSSLATAAGALLGDCGGSGCGPVGMFASLNGGGGGGGLKGGKIAVGAVAASVRAALVASDGDTSSSSTTAMMLVLNCGHDSLEASLVKVTGDVTTTAGDGSGGGGGAGGGGALSWVRRLDAVRSRGVAHGPMAGVDDVLQQQQQQASNGGGNGGTGVATDALALKVVGKAVACYEGNGIVSNAAGGGGGGGGKGGGGSASSSSSSSSAVSELPLLAPLRDELRLCVEQVLNSSSGSSLDALACVVVRGALFGGGGIALLEGVKADVAAALLTAAGHGNSSSSSSSGKDVPLFVLPQEAAAKGAAALAAAARGLPKCPFAQPPAVAGEAGAGVEDGASSSGDDDSDSDSDHEEEGKDAKKKGGQSRLRQPRRLVASDALQWSLGVAHTEGTPLDPSLKLKTSGKEGKQGGSGQHLVWSSSSSSRSSNGSNNGSEVAAVEVPGVDVLFGKDVLLPASVTRTYDATKLKAELGVKQVHASALRGTKGLCLTVVEETATSFSPQTTTKTAATKTASAVSFLRVQPLGNPLVRTNSESLEKEKGVTVTLRYDVSRSSSAAKPHRGCVQ
jgi:hypothetical protein